MNLFIYECDLNLTPEEQMATDAWLLYQTSIKNAFCFRVYQMNNTCTFGRSQKIKSIEKRELEVEKLVRRPTGGGAVVHGNDVTFALSIPNSSDLFNLKLIELYKEIHILFSRVLDNFLIDTGLSDKKVGTLPDFCFEFPNQYDLLEQDAGKKIAGSAIKKSKEGILVQGNIIHELDLEDFLIFSQQEFVSQFSLSLENFSSQRYRKCCHWENLCHQFKSPSWNYNL